MTRPSSEKCSALRWPSRPTPLNPDTSNIYPLLEDFSQYRSETDLSFKHEFVKDLNFEVSLYHSYLSDPPEGSESRDYGLTTSLGYSF